MTAKFAFVCCQIQIQIHAYEHTYALDNTLSMFHVHSCQPNTRSTINKHEHDDPIIWIRQSAKCNIHALSSHYLCWIHPRVFQFLF